MGVLGARQRQSLRPHAGTAGEDRLRPGALLVLGELGGRCSREFCCSALELFESADAVQPPVPPPCLKSMRQAGNAVPLQDRRQQLVLPAAGVLGSWRLVTALFAAIGTRRGCDAPGAFAVVFLHNRRHRKRRLLFKESWVAIAPQAEAVPFR